MPLVLILALASLTAAVEAPSSFDPAHFRFRLPVRVGPTSDGSARLTLSPDEVAKAREDLSDLILAPPKGAPVDFEAVRSSAEVSIPLVRPSRSRGTSRYEVELPEGGLTVDEVRLEVVDSPEAFDRPFVLEGESEGKWATVTAGRLFRKKGSSIPLSFAVDPLRLSALRLRVEDGSEQPLPLSAVVARAQGQTLHLKVPPGEYTLWLGGPALKAPPRARGELPAVEVIRGQLEPNPLFRVREEKRRLKVAHGLLGVGAAALLGWWALRRRRPPA